MIFLDLKQDSLRKNAQKDNHGRGIVEPNTNIIRNVFVL